MKCSLCGSAIKKGSGYLYGQKTGEVFYFCSSKCKKNMLKLKRQKRYLKWAR